MASSLVGKRPTAKQHVLAFYSTNVEADHVAFAKLALDFYEKQATSSGFDFQSTNQWDDLNAERLKDVQAVMWLDDFPHTEAQRKAFQEYMEHGGGWLGFHVAAYNDAETKWPWFVSFLGGAMFYGNNWPPLPAKLNVDDRQSVITRRLPKTLVSPANEWYSWKPDPRDNKEIQVLLTLDTSNYPLGFKDTLEGGDVPVVWTNKRFKMIYINMGHGDQIFSSATQNVLFVDCLSWLLHDRKR